MTFTCKHYFISVDETYILISTKPLDKLADEDYGNTTIVTGFDRCDGYDYYRSFPDKKVVEAIASVIEKCHIKAKSLLGMSAIPARKTISKTETRKQFEERLLTELLEETREPLCLLLTYAASYLKNQTVEQLRPMDLKTAETLERYSNLLAARIREVRE